MIKSLKAVALTLAMTVLVACGNAAPVFAYANESAVEEEHDSVSEKEGISEDTDEEKGEDQKDSEDDSRQEVEVPLIERPGVFTPDGELTLTDDPTQEISENLQFMTVSTKSGHHFYLIIDRSKTSDNVYFLNAVDEADLLNLMTAEEKEQYEEEHVEKEETPEQPIIPIVEQQDPVPEEKPVTEAPKKSNSSAWITLGFFGILGAGGLVAYYLVRVRQKNADRSLEEDREFYENEEEE